MTDRYRMLSVEEFDTESEFGDDRISVRSFQSLVSMVLDIFKSKSVGISNRPNATC